MTSTITGTTRVAGVIGDPVRHSLSPVLHNAAYRELGIDWVYVAFPVPAGEAPAALAAVRALELAGLSVTMPHKTDVASACDVCTADADALHSVNTVTPLADGRLEGSSTDGAGFVRSLRESGHDPATAAVLVLGAGGAARAVALALHRAGAAVSVAARNPDAAHAVAALTGATPVAWADRDAAAAAAAVVVQATPIGMGTDPGVPFDPAGLGPNHVVADLVYHPLETPLLRAAKAQGAATVDGLGMLVHQAALQVERWTGCDAPVAAMRAAALAALD